MKKYRLVFAAIMLALPFSVCAGSLPLNAGFALAQNSDGGSSLPGLSRIPAAESVRGDPGIAVDTRALSEGDATIMDPSDIESVARPPIAPAPDAIAPMNVARGAVGPLSPTVRALHPEVHRWQALVPGAIK
ncbi:MAG: hypothetical protein WBV61_09295 [Rhodanobacteraceae bacterium]